MAATLITGGTLLTEGGDVRGDVLLDGGRIRRIGSKLPRRGATIVSARGAVVAPGLIDLQINGAFGTTFSSASPDEIEAVARRLPSLGVTSFLPTLISLPLDALREAISRIGSAMERPGGARILGVHLEGPFLNPEKRGAHRKDYIRPPSLEEFRLLCGRSVRMMTLAPEMAGAKELIQEGSKRGVVMAAGHSTADAETVRRARGAGLGHITHVFNAMASFHHRAETILNAALTEDELTCSMIYDRHHVSAGAAKILLRAKPRGTIALVSDATAALGVTDGLLDADGSRLIVQEGEVRIEEGGRLAGGAASLWDAVRNLREDARLPLGEAVALASSVPARVIGLGRRRGVLRAGADADLLILERDGRIRAAFVAGQAC